MFTDTFALFGSSGYIGSTILKSMQTRKIKYVTPHRRDVDVFCLNSLVHYIKKNNIKYLINSIGYVGKPTVDSCEDNQEECLRTNSLLPQIMSLACKLTDTVFCHVSSGCIYNGYLNGAEGYSELDAPNFKFGSKTHSYYSGTKALAEYFVKDNEKCYIFRLRMPFNNVNDGRNYLSKLMNYDKLISMSNSITNVDEFAESLLNCVLYKLPFGIYNLTNDGFTDAKEIINICEKILNIKLPKIFISELQLQEFTKAPRSNCILNIQKSKKYNIHLRPVRESIVECLERWVDPT